METIWIIFLILLFGFMVVSNIASYKLGYSRGLLKGIVTSELFRAREGLETALTGQIM